MAGVMEKETQQTFSELAETSFIKCILCKSHFKDPRLLPCLHTFCRKCIETLGKLENQSAKNDQNTGNQTTGSSETVNGKQNDGENICDSIGFGSRSNSDITITCPICKSSIRTSKDTEFSVNVFVEALCEMYEYKHVKERHCDYCKYINKVANATSLCLDCHDNMCEGCTSAHFKTKITRGHKVITYTQVQKGLYDHDIREYQQVLCSVHTDENLSMFCEKCETLMCKECKVASHDTHSWLSLDKAVSKYHTLMKNLLQGIHQQIPAIQNYLKFLSNYTKSIENSRAMYIESIEKQAEQLHKMIDEQKAKYLEAIAEATDTEECQIQVKASNMKIAGNSLQNNETFLRNLINTGKPHELLMLHKSINARLKQLMSMQLDGVDTKLKLNFNIGNSTERNIQTIFGKLNIEHISINQSDQGLASGNALQISAILPTVKGTAELINQFDAEGTTESKDVWPTGIAVTRSDQIVIVDRDNKKIKIYDKDGELKREINGKGDNKLGSPFDAVVLKSGNIAVSDHLSETVQIFTPTGDHVLTITEGIKYPRGLAANKVGELVILDCQLKCLTIHDPKTGKKLRTIDCTNTKGSKVLVDPYYVTVSQQENLIITDTAAPNIKVFSPTGQYLANYGNYGIMGQDEVLQPYGVCCDAYGYIFMADNKNHRIHLLLPDGKFSKFLLTKSDCLWHPMGVTMTERGHLAITEALGKVKVFKYI